MEILPNPGNIATQSGNGGGSQLEIPGFPFESIIVGLIIGLIALFYVKKKSSTT